MNIKIKTGITDNLFYRAIILIPLFLSSIILGGCGVYSFTGASIPPDAKTISISYFVNNATLIEPTLSQTLTDALRNRFQSQTNLSLVEENGDLQLEGVITDYSTKPVAIQGNQTAAYNQLTISIEVKYTNTLDHTKDFDTKFSRFEQYPSASDLNTVKDQLIADIVAALVDDIFNKSVVNW